MDKFYRALDWVADHKWIVAAAFVVVFLIAIFLGGETPDLAPRQ